jgi:hypothetical protein
LPGYGLGWGYDDTCSDWTYYEGWTCGYYSY